MTWLLKLYPPRWRRRYGREVADLIAAQPFSFGAAADLVAGAVDAWRHPELAPPAAPNSEGDVTMIAKLMHLECVGHGVHISARDRATSIAVMLGGTLILTLVWLWATWEFDKSRWVMATWPMAYFVPYLVGLRHTSLKARSATAQAAFIVAFTSAVTAILLLIEWVAG